MNRTIGSPSFNIEMLWTYSLQGNEHLCVVLMKDHLYKNGANDSRIPKTVLVKTQHTQLAVMDILSMTGKQHDTK